MGGRGEWTTFQGDHGRTGRAKLPGRIMNPKVVWDIDTSASEAYFLVKADEKGKRKFTFELAGLPRWNGEMEEHWGLRPAKLDVSGNGSLHDVSGTLFFDVWGKFLPEALGFQKVRFTNTWANAGEADLQMLSFENGIDKPRTVWSVKFEPLAEAPMLVVADVDGDGQQEIAVSHWYGVTVYDLGTGTTKYQKLYRDNNHGRQYGHFSTVTLPDGKIALLVVGDFSPHIGVLMVSDGKLELLWYKTFEDDRNQGIDRRATINRVGPEPAGDYDGDGRTEVVMNFFNGGGDGRWHLVGYDALSGDVKYDVKDFFLDGSVDVDGDGRKEWVGRCYRDRALNTYAPLRILKPTGEGQTREIWSLPKGRWSLRPILPRLTVRTFQPIGARVLEPVLGRNEQGKGVTLFFSEPKARSNGEKLSAIRFYLGKPAAIWTVDGPSDGKFDALSVRNDDTLVRLEHPLSQTAEVRSDRAKIDALCQRRLVYFAPHPVVIQEGRKARIVVANSSRQVQCFQSRGKLEPKLLWTCPGRSMATDRPSPGSWHGLEAGDVDGDGATEVLYVAENPEGGACLIARNLDGIVRWQHDFPGFNGYVADWGDSMTTFWALGHFLKKGRIDVFVSNRRSTMHSDESAVIDVRRNRTVWSKDTLDVREPWTDASRHTRGYGGSLPVTADFDGDGLDDVALTYPCELSVVDGSNGSQLFVENLGPVAGTKPSKTTDWGGVWLIGGRLMVADLDGDGARESLVTHAEMVLAYRHREGRCQMMWRTESGDGASCLPAMADTDGDGVLKLGLAGCRDGFRCVESKTGRVLWTIAGGASSNCVACDIDGDGLEEFLYADGKLVKAVRDGRVTWEINLPTSVTQLAVADVYGDVASEVLAGADNGRLYCINNNS